MLAIDRYHDGCVRGPQIVHRKVRVEIFLGQGLELRGVKAVGGSNRECGGIERAGQSRFHHHAARQIDSAASGRHQGDNAESKNDCRAAALGAGEPLHPIAGFSG
jgi:hypothetical protein